MPTQQTVLVVGGTGRTGRRVLQQLLSREMKVRAMVRSVEKLPPGTVNNPNLTVIEANLLALGTEDLLHALSGCDAVISCLGHVISFKGVFGPPRDLVTQATTRLCRGIEALQPARLVKFILMSSVSVHHPGGLDTRRGWFDTAVVRIIRSLVPPAEDNQQAANFLYGGIGMAGPFVQWAVVRPDTLLEGDGSEYILHEGLVNSLFAPGRSTMANVAHFMGELAANPKAWEDWRGKFPVIVDAPRAKD